MKFSFIIMSIFCAIAFSVLSMILATGRIPGREPPPPPEPPAAAAEEAREAAVDEELAVFSEKGKAVEELIDALDKERNKYEQKADSLKTEAEETRMQRELLDQLKAQLLDIRGVLDEKISAIEEDERTNLQRLAEVTGRMEPESAAQVLAEMEKERAAKILYLVNERRAAGIMDAAVAMGDQGVELAAEWADIIRRLKKNNDK